MGLVCNIQVVVQPESSIITVMTTEWYMSQYYDICIVKILEMDLIHQF